MCICRKSLYYQSKQWIIALLRENPSKNTIDFHCLILHHNGWFNDPCYIYLLCRSFGSRCQPCSTAMSKAAWNRRNLWSFKGWGWETSHLNNRNPYFMGPYKPRSGLGLMSLSPIIWKCHGSWSTRSHICPKRDLEVPQAHRFFR